MHVLELPGRITSTGKLEVELPKGLPAGDIVVQIRFDEAIADTIDTFPGLPQPLPRAEFLRWLDENPPDMAWDDLAEDQDAAKYIHDLRRRSVITLDDQE